MCRQDLNPYWGRGGIGFSGGRKVPKRKLLIPLFLTVCLAASHIGCARHMTKARYATKPPVEELETRVHFSTASDHVIKGDRWVLEHNAQWMRDNPQAVLILEGHCDERGSDEYNLELGDRRSRRVKEELVRLGVPAAALAVVSFGERRPLNKRHTYEAWRKNRRVEFTPR